MRFKSAAAPATVSGECFENTTEAILLWEGSKYARSVSQETCLDVTHSIRGVRKEAAIRSGVNLRRHSLQIVTLGTSLGARAKLE